MENKFKTVSHETLLDRDIGKKGTPEREKFDAKVQAGVICLPVKRASQTKEFNETTTC